MHPKDADGIATGVDLNQTALLGLGLHCLPRPVRKLRIIMAYCKTLCICWLVFVLGCSNNSLVIIMGVGQPTHTVPGQDYSRRLTVLIEPPHEKTNKMACAPSEDSDQPGHPPNLISLRCLQESLGP